LRSDGGARVPGVAVVSLHQRIMVFLLLLVAVGGAVERSSFLLSTVGDGEVAERILLLRADMGELTLLDLLCEFGVGVGVRCLASWRCRQPDAEELLLGLWFSRICCGGVSIILRKLIGRFSP